MSTSNLTIPEAVFTVVERTLAVLRVSGADPGEAQEAAVQLVCRLVHLLPVCQDDDCLMIVEHRHVGEFVVALSDTLAAEKADDCEAGCEPCGSVAELTKHMPIDPEEEAEAKEAPAAEKLAAHLVRGGEIPGANGGRRRGRI